MKLLQIATTVADSGKHDGQLLQNATAFLSSAMHL